MVTKPCLANQSSQMARALRIFIMFLMGMPEKTANYPETPTQDEVSKWHSMQEFRSQKLQTHFQRYKSTIADHPPAEQKVLMKREESRVAKIITPPPFIATCDRPSTTWVIPLIMKKEFEQKLQRSGFSRFTFHWTTFPFHSSSWNRAIALIVAEAFYSWLKTMPELICGAPGDIPPMVGRWISGQGKIMIREAKNPTDVLKQKEETAKKAQKSRVKKQVC
jgi:hypothetical protein